MKMQKAACAAVMALVLSAGMANAGTRLFGDSVLNLGDGFSDEITGNGPVTVLIAGSETPDELHEQVAQLRKTSRVHLIRTEGAAPALPAYLEKMHLADAPVIGGGAALAHAGQPVQTALEK
jgi:hypothetical protein